MPFFGFLTVTKRVCPYFCLGIFLELYHQFFLNFGMVLETHMKLCMTELDFSGVKNLPLKLGKWTKNGLKTGLFDFVEKFSHQFLLNLFCIENIYYFLCSYTNPVFKKNFIPEIQAKMFLANQIAGFLNQPYLQNKSMNQPDCQHVDTNSHKLRVSQRIFGQTQSKMGVASLVMGLQLYLLDSQQQLEGSYEVGSDCPFVLQSDLVFSCNWFIRFL